MSKGTRKVMGALFGAVLALVLAVCILCATFARYTTSSTGDSGAVSVELWDVRATGAESVDVDTKDLRPDYNTSYDGSDSRYRLTETPIPLLTFENLGNLDADVTLKCVTGGDGTTAEVTLNWDDENFAGWGEGWKEDDGTNAYMQTIMSEVGQVMTDSGYGLNYAADCDGFNELVNCGMSGKGLFSVEFGTVSGSEFTSFDTFSLKAENNEQVTVYAKIIWTSHYYETGGTGSTSYGFTWEEFSDAIDTIIGMYVESIGFTIEWEAVQASQTGI